MGALLSALCKCVSHCVSVFSIHGDTGQRYLNRQQLIKVIIVGMETQKPRNSEKMVMRVKGFCAYAGKQIAVSRFLGIHGEGEEEKKDLRWTVLTQHLP